ncbi:GLPGLI family protein [Chitinophaga skermanii]|uniref:GLPGLI family protein n=1 Tax=Chitinophaga skermanii TaxID=331697 RepID=A0A327Q1C4_9BACT|nr:DUF4412 domain-containing protein [Chitinophaga skermanii]RAI97674.1 GLPGLI family protein [Chitinophaga skermanii]
MKKLTFLVAGLLCLQMAQAQQQKSGKISYDITINVHASLRPDQQQFKDILPATATTEATLYFNGSHAKTVMPGPKDMESEEGNTRMTLRAGSGQDIARYIDPATTSVYSLQQDGNGKKKLIQKPYNASTDNEKYKVGTKTKTILGFVCKEITVKNNNDKTTLWVTDQLPFQGGVIGIYSPYGAVLAFETNRMQCTATNIKYEDVNEAEVMLPKDLPIEQESK